jgi:membrane protein implicated in regulation of membrane protease activity
VHDNRPSTADDVFLVVLGIGILLCMALYALVVYVIIPLVIFAAVVGVIGLIIAGMVWYVRSHAWLIGGVLMLVLNLFAGALTVYAAMLAHKSMSDSNAASAAVLTGLLLLLTLLASARLRPVVRHKDAEAKWAELQQQRQEELLASERQARQEDEERRKREEQEHILHPGDIWLSSSPTPCGEQVVVQIKGSYSYRICNNSPQKFYADGCYEWFEGNNPGMYKPHNSLFFDGDAEPARPFVELRPSHVYRFLHVGTGEPLAVFLRRDHAFTSFCENDDSLTISIEPLSPADHAFFCAEQEQEQRAKADERRREDEEAAAKREREARELEGRRRHRLRTLEARYDRADLAWRSDPAARLRYARDHHDDLLSRRTAIIHAFESFHRDTDFTEAVRTNYADWYGKIDDVFYFEMVSIAESLPKEPPRQKLTAEERQAKFERHRARAMERERVRIDDESAMLAVAFESVEELLDARNAKIAEIRARSDLDRGEQDELIRVLKAVTDHRLAQFSKEQRDGAAHDAAGREAWTPSTAPAPEPVVLDE